jgi:hypothetical protein
LALKFVWSWGAPFPVTKTKRPRIQSERGGDFWQYQDLLTPSPSRATHPVPAIVCGVEHVVRAAVGDEDHLRSLIWLSLITLLLAT